MKNFIQSTLVVSVLLSAAGAEEVKYALVGGTVTLKPPGEFHLKTHYLYWHFGDLEVAWCNPSGGFGFNSDKKWKATLSLTAGLLTIRNISREHFGTFSCKMTVNGRTLVTYRLLRVSVSMNPPSPLLSGESLSLFCDAESPGGDKKPEIRWLNPQGEEMKNGQGLMTERVAGRHSGQWICVVTHEEKVNKVGLSVTVVDLAPAPSHPQYTSKLSSLTIPCSIPSHISWEQIKTKGLQGGNWLFFPKPGSGLLPADPQRLFSLSMEDPLAWKADQHRGLSPAADLEKGVLSLSRHRGREDDVGDYVCSLKFRNGVTLNRTVHIDVLRIISSPGTDLISGQLVNLTCSPGHPLPSDLRLKWFPPEQSSLSSLTSDRPSAHLTIREVGTGDGGKWRCELWQGDALLTSAVTTLKIEPKMSLWILEVTCSVTVLVILLVTLSIILYWRRQRKKRHPRRRLCQCKHPKPKGFYRS